MSARLESLLDAARRAECAHNDEALEAARIEADLLRDQDKGPKLAARNDAQALAAQVMHQDAMRRAGWL